MSRAGLAYVLLSVTALAGCSALAGIEDKYHTATDASASGGISGLGGSGGVTTGGFGGSDSGTGAASDGGGAAGAAGGPCAYTFCNGTCKDTDTDSTNCGFCGHDCLGAKCSQGLCEPEALATGLALPNSLVVDQDNAYWASAAPPGEVYERSLSGGSPQGLASGQLATGDYGLGLVAIDSVYVYFAFTAGCNTASPIERVPIAGGSATTLTSLKCPADLVADDDGNVYVLHALGVGTVPKTGGTLSSLVPLTSSEGAHALVLDAQYLYFTEETYAPNQGGIIRAQRDGGAETALYAGYGQPYDLVEVGSDLYWVSPQPGGVWKMPATGGDATNITAAYNPQAITADSNRVYWANNGSTLGDGKIEAVPTAGGAVIEYAINQPFARGIAVSGSYIYWLTGDFDPSQPKNDGKLMRVAK